MCVLERGELGRGTSHVSAGMLAPISEADAGEQALLRLGLESARAWPAFAAELEAASGIGVDLRPNGTLLVARDRDEAEALERELALRHRFGLRAERLLPSRARRVEPALAPLGARDDLAVDRHRDAAGARLDSEVGEQLGDRRAGALARLAVDEDHAATPAKRCGEKAASAGSPHSSATTRSAVTGASSTPLR